jgi:hypothetical protein
MPTAFAPRRRVPSSTPAAEPADSLTGCALAFRI